MKIDGFLKVPDIPGASVRDGHEDEMEVFGVAFDMQAPHDANTRSRRVQSTGLGQFRLREEQRAYLVDYDGGCRTAI